MYLRSFSRAALAGAIACALPFGQAAASGFSLPELSTAGIGLANALVANPDETGAIAYNPAAMGFHGSLATVGAYVIAPTFEVETQTGTYDSEGADQFLVPMLQFAIAATDKLRLGLAVNSPFGLETRWQLGTFPTLSQPASLAGRDLTGLFHPTMSKVEMVAFTPTAAYRVSEELSLSAGIDVYWIKSGILNTYKVETEGDGTGYGFNLGALYAKGPWSVGLSFHSASTVTVEGSSYNAVRLQEQDAELDLNLPWRLALGARYEVNEQLAVELDWQRTGWSEFDEIRIQLADGSQIVSRNDWTDANAFRLGLTYQIKPATQLRFGYSYDESGSNDDYFSARIPDADRQLFSIGAAQDLGDGWSIEAGYMFVKFDDTDFRGSRAYAFGDDINGTDATAGDYSGNAHLFGMEIAKRF